MKTRIRQYHGIALGEKGRGVPLVLIHGLTMGRRIWSPLVDTLAKEFRVIAIDLPGHGESSDLPDTEDYEFAPLAHRLHDTLTHIGVANPILAGHSIGAVLAGFYAARFPARAVVNIDQTLDIAEFARTAQGLEMELRGSGFAPLWQKVRDGFGLEHLPEEGRKLEARVSRPRQEIVLAYWDGLLTAEPEAFQRFSDDNLRAIHASYIAFHGVLPGADYPDWLAERVPQARCLETGIHCHFPHLAAPEKFCSVIREVAQAG